MIPDKSNKKHKGPKAGKESVKDKKSKWQGWDQRELGEDHRLGAGLGEVLCYSKWDGETLEGFEK